MAGQFPAVRCLGDHLQSNLAPCSSSTHLWTRRTKGSLEAFQASIVQHNAATGPKRGMGKWWLPALALFALVAAGCELPRDAGGTTERVRSEKVLRAGFSERPPWVKSEQDRPEGIEPRLVEAFAAQFGAKVDWVAGSESSLVEALRTRRIHVLVCGLDRDSPWVDHAAATEPYLKTAVIVATPNGSLPSSGIQGQTVAHANLRPDLAALIAAKNATPEPAADLGRRLAAVYDFQARSLGLEPTTIVLRRTQRVLLVAPGESRLLYELDRFLAHAGPRAVTAGDKPEGQ
jgi:polar amino acid transport system substrate-binding protein